jgi:hypothetical protein
LKNVTKKENNMDTRTIFFQHDEYPNKKVKCEIFRKTRNGFVCALTYYTDDLKTYVDPYVILGRNKNNVEYQGHKMENGKLFYHHLSFIQRLIFEKLESVYRAEAV